MPDRSVLSPPSTSAVEDPRLIAFYLPQFHPIPENDDWWGKGFTEWINVARSRPQFPGHVQPRLPTSLGFYDLRLPETRIAQSELAQRYGVYGFCYYHYWFSGRTLLQRPLEDMVTSGTPNFPFCVCWANENWTRRWDGKESEILMRQVYSAEDDLQHIRYLLPMLADPRYIRVNGKPLLLVYRTELLPNPSRTADQWREEALRLGVGEIHLGRVDSFVGDFDPRTVGFDSAIEFAPNWRALPPSTIASKSEMLRRLARGQRWRTDLHIYDYEALAHRMLQTLSPDYPRFRCACPSWDNSPRRAQNATLFRGSTPELFAAWLRELFARRQRIGSELAPVFVNAWNEWAEGAHLEPCTEYGSRYLEAIASSLEAPQSRSQR